MEQFRYFWPSRSDRWEQDTFKVLVYCPITCLTTCLLKNPGLFRSGSNQTETWKFRLFTSDFNSLLPPNVKRIYVLFLIILLSLLWEVITLIGPGPVGVPACLPRCLCSKICWIFCTNKTKEIQCELFFFTKHASTNHGLSLWFMLEKCDDSLWSHRRDKILLFSEHMATLLLILCCSC